jgi:hypothetical protein
MKAKALAICLLASLAILASSAFAEARVDVSAVISKDFMSSPSFDQAVRALGNDSPFCGIGWEVVLGHIGIGGQYLVDFHEDSPDSWWLDWNGEAAYASYHLFGARSAVDPFVDAGIGSAGRVFLGPADCDAARLAISVYPFASAGASIDLHGLRLGAKLSYALGPTAIPATTIPDYPIGRFQVCAFAGFSFGPRWPR